MSQATQILDYLKAGNTLTPLRAITLFHCMRLAGRIQELRDAGYRIETEMIELSSGKRIAQYRMNELVT